jgi:hypothetical protein
MENVEQGIKTSFVVKKQENVYKRQLLVEKKYKLKTIKIDSNYFDIFLQNDLENLMRISGIPLMYFDNWG